MLFKRYAGRAPLAIAAKVIVMSDRIERARCWSSTLCPTICAARSKLRRGGNYTATEASLQDLQRRSQTRCLRRSFPVHVGHIVYDQKDFQ